MAATTLTKYQRDAKKANRRRAHLAERILRDWMQMIEAGAWRDAVPTLEARMDALTDLLTNFRHYCRGEGLDLPRTLDRSYEHYREELLEEGGLGDGIQ